MCWLCFLKATCALSEASKLQGCVCACMSDFSGLFASACYAKCCFWIGSANFRFTTHIHSLHTLNPPRQLAVRVRLCLQRHSHTALWPCVCQWLEPSPLQSSVCPESWRTQQEGRPRAQEHWREQWKWKSLMRRSSQQRHWEI